jgi:methylmalonyl-CoA/ethylmalonyl-CoA epimerase
MTDTAIFKTLHHVCIVVADLDASVAYYESIGVGPWNAFGSLQPYLDKLESPDPEGFLRLRYRYANLDNVQIQLCEPPPGNTPQRKFLDTHGEGVFHLGFTVPDCNAAEASAQAVGLQVKMKSRLPDGSGFTYFDTAQKGAGVTLEIRANRLS